MRSTPETLEKYPFDFELVISYELGGDGITVHYQVANTGEEEDVLSIGGHPAFNVHLLKKGIVIRRLLSSIFSIEIKITPTFKRPIH